MPNFDALTRDSVRAAIDACDQIGRDAFLERYGFKEAREYFLIHDGHAYDSKAIVGVAHGVATGEYLRSGDFTGGAHVAEVLRRLGFPVTGVADWTWPELVLAGGLLLSAGWDRTLRAHEKPVIELSRFLRDRNPEMALSPTFRSPGSVQHKLEDLRTSRPSYSGAATRGGKLTAQMARALVDELEKMLELARLLRDSPDLVRDDQNRDGTSAIEAPDAGIATAIEGRLIRRVVIARERDRALRDRKLKSVVAAGRPIACEVCSFDFQTSYGEHGEGYIQVHHVLPLHVSGQVTTTLDDLVLLCANCHVMIHHGKEWKTPDELRGMVN
ncbi:HNH endonuclease [Gordonia sp. N1V]|uniref:HNH endonuclease n=1 Tax=Gordonia sp. N1V TaxID=3034163 RepID=UPI0023E0D2F1|nr:HNH endonuclease [Gordonia sp. N1V]MDF3284979.1 HNH endonuclease [Gordonia sp. N1V]